MKKCLLMALSLLMMVQLGACSSSKEEEFKATKTGFGGDVVVTVKVQDGKITSISAISRYWKLKISVRLPLKNSMNNSLL